MRSTDTFSAPEVSRILGCEIIDVVEAIRGGQFAGTYKSTRGLYRIPRVAVEQVLVEKAVRQGNRREMARTSADLVATLLTGNFRETMPGLQPVDAGWGKAVKGNAGPDAANAAPPADDDEREQLALLLEQIAELLESGKLTSDTATKMAAVLRKMVKR